MRDPYIYIGSFDRPNLDYQVIHTRNAGEKIDHLMNIVKSHFPSIIYTRTQSDTEQVAATLSKRGIPALSYHAGMKKGERAEAQRKFTDGEADVIVATIAFGMGIDKANVRSVVHYDIPDSMERYHQETGRAGRDRELSYCTLLYNERDVDSAKFILQQVYSDPQRLEAALDKLEQMRQYALSGGNHREQIVAYFTAGT
jgi:ATP-dependent DNA helicase RecQ